MAPLIVAITLAIPTAIFAEAGLSFLGIGINEPTPSLGKMVADSAQYMGVYWYLGFFPTLAIALACSASPSSEMVCGTRWIRARTSRHADARDGAGGADDVSVQEEALREQKSNSTAGPA